MRFCIQSPWVKKAQDLKRDRSFSAFHKSISAFTLNYFSTVSWTKRKKKKEKTPPKTSLTMFSILPYGQHSLKGYWVFFSSRSPWLMYTRTGKVTATHKLWTQKTPSSLLSRGIWHLTSISVSSGSSGASKVTRPPMLAVMGSGKL